MFFVITKNMMLLRRAGLPGAIVALYLVSLLIVLTYAGAHVSTGTTGCGETVVAATTPTNESCGALHVDGPESGLLTGAYLLMLALPGSLALGLILAAMRMPPRFLRLAYWWSTWGAIVYAGTITVLLLSMVIHPRSEARADLGAVELKSGQVIVTGEANGRFPYGTVSNTAELRERAEQSFGPGTTLRSTGNLTFEATLPRATPKVILLAGISGLWHVLSLLAVLWSLRAVIGRALRGSPFDVRAVRAVRSLAFAIVAAGPGDGIVSHLVSRELLRSAGGSANGLAWSLDWWPVLTAILVFALAEIWRHGHRLQRDAEGTI